MITAVFLGFFAANLMDPALIVASLICGYAATRWYYFVVGVIVAVAFKQMVFQLIFPGREVYLLALLAAFAASAVWACPTFLVRRRVTTR